MSEGLDLTAAVEAAKTAMACVTPPPGVTMNAWLGQYGRWALVAGGIAAAAPSIEAQVREQVAREIEAIQPFGNAGHDNWPGPMLVIAARVARGSKP